MKLEWRDKLLHRAGIEKPDGRPLYQYRVTDEEFEMLKSALSDITDQAGINNALKNSLFSLAFVIYGAEWWRRHYAGNWRWEGIFSSFGADVSLLTPNQRGYLVETGLHRWQRKVRTTNNYRNFLGSVAIEGGLPLKQMVNASGWLHSTLSQITRRLVKLGEDGFEPGYVVRQYAHHLPQTYRREEVYEILGDMVSAAVSLKKTHDLTSKDDPIMWLNHNVPEWREQFPLPVDDAAGNAILTEMVRTAVSSEHDTNAVSIEGVRYLSGVSTGVLQLKHLLTAQRFYLLNGLFTEKELEDVPGRFHIEFFNQSGKTWRFADAYRVYWKGQPALKINNTELELSDEEAVDTIRMRFKYVGDSFLEREVGAEGLNRTVPWIFVKRGDRWQFAGQASQKLKADRAVVWVPFELDAQYESGGLPRKIGEDSSGDFFESDKNLIISNAEDQYIVKVNQDEETLVEYLLRGKRLDYVCLPSEVFIGKPSLLVVNRISGYRKTVNANQVRSRAVGSGSTAWRTLTDTPPGVHELQILDDDVIMYRKRIGFLPEGMCIQHKSGASPKEGSIKIDHISGWQAACLNSTVRYHTEYKDGLLELTLSAPQLPPADIEIELRCDEALYPIRVTVPYPSKGAIFVDPKGTQSSTSSDLFLDALHGYRIRFFAGRLGRSTNISIRLELIDRDLPDTNDLYIEFNRPLSGSVADLPLVDFLTDIRELLAISKNLDACVKFTLFHSGDELVNLRIRCFRMVIEPDKTTGEVALPPSALSDFDIDELSSVKLEAMRLSQPEQAPRLLESRTTQGVERGIWKFSPESRSPGPWLIYSTKNSGALVRPLLWNIPGQQPSTNIKSIHAAVCIDDPQKRQEAFQKLFLEMAMDNTHSGWEYLSCLWKKYQHLPLTSFDVWKATLSNTDLLAAMVIHLGLEPATLERLQEEMPVLWELIPISTWERILKAYRDNLKTAIDDEIVTTLLRELIEQIAELNDVMGTVAKIIKQRVLNEPDNDLDLMKRPNAGQITAELIANQRQILLQRQSDAQWPELLKGEIEQKWSNLPDSLSRLIQGEQYHRATVVHFPFVLAYRLFFDSEDLEAPTHVFKYRRLKQFDEDWYNATFNFACGYWSQQHCHR